MTLNSRRTERTLFSHLASGHEAVLAGSKFATNEGMTSMLITVLLTSLAYIEMRLTITRLLWNFDFECVPGYENWNIQNIYLGWQKVPLPIKLEARDVE